MSCNCRSHNGFLMAKGLEEAAQRELELAGVAGMELEQYLDKVGSVSALIEPSEPIFVDALIDEQHRRFLDGCYSKEAD